MTANRQPNLWRRFRRKVRDEGPRYTALLILNEIMPRSLVDAKFWVVLSIDLSTFADAEVPDVGIRWADVVDDHGSAPPGGEYAAIENMLARGELAAVIERDGRVVARHLYTAKSFIQKEWLQFVFRDREIYGTLCFVEPEFRGQGFANQLNIFAFNEFAGLRYLRSYCIIDALNRSSLRASVKVRYRRIGRITFVRCCGFTVIRIGRRVRAGFWSAENPLVVEFSEFDDS